MRLNIYEYRNFMNKILCYNSKKGENEKVTRFNFSGFLARAVGVFGRSKGRRICHQKGQIRKASLSLKQKPHAARQLVEQR